MKFPDTPNFRGFSAPSRVEVDAAHLPVIDGTVPSDHYLVAIENLLADMGSRPLLSEKLSIAQTDRAHCPSFPPSRSPSR